MKISKQRLVTLWLFVLTLQTLAPATTTYARNEEAPPGTVARPLPEGKVGQPYDYQLQAEGGLAPLTWRVVNGELPPGLTLDADGKLNGIPTTPRREAYQLVIEVADSSQPPQRLAQPFLLTVQAAPLRLVTTSNPLRIVQQPLPAPEPLESHAPNHTVVSDRGYRAERRQPLTSPISWPYIPPSAARSDAASSPLVEQDPAQPGNAEQNNPAPQEEKTEQLNPARFINIYEVPKARSVSFQANTTIKQSGDNAKIYGKLIYHGRTAGLNNTRLTADEGSTIVVVPDVEGSRDIAFNTIYMHAELASADTKQNVEIANYSEVGTAPSADAFIIGASFESAKDILDMLITLQRRATDILKYTLEIYDDGEIDDEKFKEILGITSSSSVQLGRARESFTLYAPEVETITSYLATQSNRNITERIANNIFHINRDTLTAIAKQFTADVALLKSQTPTERDAATIRLLLRTAQIYKDFKAARAEIRYMAEKGALKTPKEPGRQRLVERLDNTLQRINTPGTDAKLIKGLRREAEAQARDIYAYDRSAEAITSLRDSKFPVGWVSLDEVRAKDGDTLKLTVQIQNPGNQGTGNKVPFYIAVKKYGIKLHWASSFLFLKRLNITPADTMPDANGNTLSEVNFAPSPGVSYGLTFFKRGDDGGSKFLRALAPTIGMNVSFMNFKDPGFDLSTMMFTNTTGTDVQVGAGPIVSFFDNKLHFTHGWNLNVDRKRRYWGIGFGFVEFAKELGKYIKSQ